MPKNLDVTFDGGDLNEGDLDDAGGPIRDVQPLTPTPEGEYPIPPSPVARWTPRKVYIQDADYHLYIDIETVPDWERLEKHGIVQKDEEYDPLTWGHVTNVIMNGTVADFLAISSRMEKAPAEAIQAMIELEQGRTKPRRTIIDPLINFLSMKGKQSDKDIKKFSVSPEYCRIAAFGYAIGNGPIVTTYCADKDDEAKALTRFWELALECAPIVGYNHLAFDLPVIFVRSGILRVPVSRRLDTSPWRSNDVIDLMKARFGNNTAIGMKQLARLYGIPTPPGDVDGSQVADLVEQGRIVELLNYLEGDVAITRELYGFLKGTFCD